VTVWAWVKLTACLWLIRKAFRLAWWLLLAVAAVAAWPVTVVTAAGYITACCAAGRRSGCTGPRPGRCRSPPPG